MPVLTRTNMAIGVWNDRPKISIMIRHKRYVVGEGEIGG